MCPVAWQANAGRSSFGVPREQKNVISPKHGVSVWDKNFRTWGGSSGFRPGTRRKTILPALDHC